MPGVGARGGSGACPGLVVSRRRVVACNCRHGCMTLEEDGSVADIQGINQLAEEVMRGRIGRRALLKRAAALGLAGPTLAALLAACGGDDDDDDDDTSTGGDTPTATSPPDEGDDEATEAEDEGEDEPEPTEAEAGDDDEGDEDEGDDSGSGAEPTGEIVIMQGVDATTLAPLLRNATPESTIIVHVFDMMLDRDPETLEILPNIIQEWSVSDDDLTWEFKLVEG